MRNMLTQAQDIVCAMDQAIEAAGEQEISIEEMWLELDLQCQRLAQLADTSEDASDVEQDDDYGEDDDDAQELDFGEEQIVGDAALLDAEDEL